MVIEKYEYLLLELEARDKKEQRGFLKSLLEGSKKQGKQEAQKIFLEEINNRIKLIEEVKEDSDEIEKRICDSKLMELIKLKLRIG